MNPPPFVVQRHVRNILVVMLIVLISVSLFSSCSKADANPKKDKSKQTKPKPEVDEEETAKVADEKTKTDHETDVKTGGKNSDEKEKVKDTDKKTDLEDQKSGATKLPGKPDDTSNLKKDDKKPADDLDKLKKSAGESVWRDLIRGNKMFMSGSHTGSNYSASRKSLLKTQSPDVVVLGCSDSRVPPELVFNKNLGELFVVRDAGNIADKVSLGSIEYAIEHLHSKVLVVLGHESCGAIAATVSGEKLPSANLMSIVDSISPAFAGSKTCIIGGESNLSCVELNVKQSSKDILAKSAIIKKAVDEGRLTIIRAVYKMGTGEVVRLD